jgi:ribosomal protein L32
MIRSIRRNRHKHRAYLRQLDAIALKAIKRSMLWSMSTWHGTRCPGCGTNCRPHHLADLSGNYGGMFIEAFTSACEYVKCPGERQW